MDFYKLSLRLAFHLLFAKFFFICALTDSWMFLSRAVSPAILTGGQEVLVCRNQTFTGKYSPLKADTSGLLRLDSRGGNNNQNNSIRAIPGVLQSLLTGVAFSGAFLHQVNYEIFSCNIKKFDYLCWNSKNWSKLTNVMFN